MRPATGTARGTGSATICMTGERCFADSNVLVYLFDDDSPAKQSRARELIAETSGTLVLSVQILGEFFHVVTRRLRRPLSRAQALYATENLQEFEVWPIHRFLVHSAMRRSIASRLSYWDSLIVETAIEAGATVLLTEDLQDGQMFGGLRVLNPFHVETPLGPE